MIRNVYIYLVLFVTLMMVIGGSIGAYISLTDMIAPNYYYQSYEEFREWQVSKNDNLKEENREEVTEEELQSRYDRLVEDERQKSLNRSRSSLIKNIGWIIIPLPVLIYFQRKLKTKA